MSKFKEIQETVVHAADADPKRAQGATKPALGLVPPVAIAEAAMAYEDGAYIKEYGPYNWRTTGVESMTYINAIKRHIDAYLDGEEFTSDSAVPRGRPRVHNLGAVIASAGILLDAAACGKLRDNRPPKGTASLLHDELREVKRRAESAPTTDRPLAVGDRVTGVRALPEGRNVGKLVAGTIKEIDSEEPCIYVTDGRMYAWCNTDTVKRTP